MLLNQRHRQHKYQHPYILHQRQRRVHQLHQI